MLDLLRLAFLETLELEVVPWLLQSGGKRLEYSKSKHTLQEWIVTMAHL